MEQKSIKAKFMLTGSMLIFGSIGVFRKYIPLSSGVLAFSRGLLGALFLCAFIKISGRKTEKNIDRKKLLFLILTGCFMGINWMLLFEAYNNTTVSTATLCYYMEPTIVILLSPFFFREKLTIKKIVYAAVSFAGMVLVSGVVEGGSRSSSDMKGILLGLGAAVFYSAVVILNKKVDMEDAYEKTSIQLFAAAIIMIPYIFVTREFSNIQLNVTAIIMIIIVGIVHTGIAYVLYFGSIKSLNSQSIAVMSYIDPVAALLFSALILQERMTIYGVIGAILILGSAGGSLKT